MSYKTSLACASAFAAAAIFAGVGPASAHTIIGNRIFPATLAIDDPGVDDELTIPTFAYSFNSTTTYPPMDGTQNYEFNLYYAKRITSDLQVSIDSTFLHAVNPRANGWEGIETEVKDQIMVNTEHEFVVSLAVAEAWGASGTPGIAPQYTTITPKAFIGKGFGDLENEWLRPFAVTGEIDYDVPTVSNIYNNNILIQQNPTTLDYGFTIQYSLNYMNGYVREVPEILRNLTLDIEAQFTTPVSNIGPSVLGSVPGTHETTGVIGPGIYYIAHDYQIGLYGAFPINEASGKHPGIMANVDFYLDDLFPNTLGKPIFGPEQSRAFDPWHAFPQ
ncbi:MAG TPA: hypothetical protein VLZ74_06730 [Methylocella sp.]|nr:hypothetical protein [Methylocella sp.]